MTSTATITPEVVAQHGLRPDEFERIVSSLGREPTLVELGMYSAMWSEHCAYKHSRPVLRALPTEGPRVVVGPGENAGVIDIGGGLCVVFKIESHNHPSAVEPYEGAATGVGGILRDIFTMGARPVALLNNLRFGEPDDPQMHRLIEGVVEGIAGYGNCVGVPTVAGDVMFDPGHAGNILVNVMCVGIARIDDVVRAQARGLGNRVLYFGSPTGRDGLHGASFASEELSEEALERRGAVQVGDPFMGKKILEATLDLIRRGLVVGIQDMGAAGVTCSTCEMASKAGTGMAVDLDRVPQRADGMSAYEIMISESQERMLAVVEPDRVEEALAVCARWECDGAIVGEITDTGRVTVSHRGEVVADLEARQLADDAPVYHPEETAPPRPNRLQTAPEIAAREVNSTLLQLLASPTIASKRWAYRRYDHMVQARTVVRPGDGDAAVLRIFGDADAPDRFLSVTSDGNHRWVARDARIGGQLAVCEAARNTVCVGAEPLGLTNCLNFGSPERAAVFGAFRRCVEGMAEACRALGVPVTGGNVSLYNESGGVAIPPTPVVGMVGLIEDEAHITRSAWTAAGDRIVVLGPAPDGVAGSEFAKQSLGPDAPGETPRGCLPEFDLEAEVRLQRLTLRLIREGVVRSAHDVSEGGLAVTLAECCLRGLGADVDAVPGEGLAEGLFGELPPRVVVTVRPADLDRLLGESESEMVEAAEIGTVTDGGLRLLGTDPIPIDALRCTHETPPGGGSAQ